MSLLEKEIERVCKFSFTFSNMDTVFIDKHSKVKWEFVNNIIPEPLKAHFNNLKDLLILHETNVEYDVIFHSSSIKINYISAKVFDNDEYAGSIVVGPYLLEEPTTLMIHDVLFNNNISISIRPLLEQYYLSLPLIGTYKAKTIGEFLAYMILKLPAKIVRNPRFGDLSYNFQTEISTIPETVKQKKDTSIAIIEDRYRMENNLLQAVQNGDIERLEQLLNDQLLYVQQLPDRFPNDPLRSRKNISFVTNSLLRKAAEKGGVHPVYIDSISEKFAIQIEKTSSLQQLAELHNKMHFEYCDAVKKLSLKNFPLPIRKAIEFIRIHLDEYLSLEVIANAIHLSTYELSRQFKKETGMNITEYINKLRMNEALKIMESENFSITEISHMVGFNDVNYFTKVFKKLNGITPSQYRKGKNAALLNH
jgi:two-component system, response regulator YesN